MRITDLRTHLFTMGYRNVLLLRLEIEDGTYGWGEATLEGRAATVEAAIGEAGRYLIGRDNRMIEAHWQALYRGLFWVGGPVLTSALSAVDQALWDIRGKQLGVPVYELLGGAVRRDISTYGNGWFHDRELESYPEAARQAVANGARMLKWDPFGLVPFAGDLSTAQRRRALRSVREIREAVGPEVDLLVEAHAKLDIPSAIRVGHELAEYGVYFFEEPVPPENVDAMAQVARAVPVPVATGEHLFTRHDFRPLLEAQAAAIVQPDPCHAGGLTELKKIAALCEPYYIPVAPHNPNGPVATAACLHFAASTPNFLVLELNLADFDIPWRGDVFTESWSLEGDQIRVSDAPGLGVDVNEQTLRGLPYEPLELGDRFYSELKP